MIENLMNVKNSLNSRQVTTYLDARHFEKLETYRDQQGINRSDAVEELLVRGLNSLEAPKERTFLETQFDLPKPKPKLPDVPELDALAEKVMIRCAPMTGLQGLAPHHLVRTALALYVQGVKEIIALENTPQKIAEREAISRLSQTETKRDV